MAIVNLHKELDKEKLEALVEIYEKINKLDLQGMLEFLIHQTIETLGVKRCAIFKVFPEERWWHWQLENRKMSMEQA